MRKRYLYLILIIGLLSSCSKKKENITPTKETIAEVSESIMINNQLVFKTADVYATSNEKLNNVQNLSSSFNVNEQNGVASVKVKLNNIPNQITEGYLNFENASQVVNIDYNSSTNEEWSTTKGHQKGSKFEIIKIEKLEASSGHVNKLTIKASCFLYNDKGEFVPFSCITNIKF